MSAPRRGPAARPAPDSGRGRPAEPAGLAGRAPGPRAALAAAACAAALLAAGPACAGSTTARDADGSQWAVADDPADGSQDFLLRRVDANGQLDPRFGRDGLVHFTLGTGNDPPASLRVDAARRLWIVGSALAGNQPQPVVARFLADGSPDTRWGVQGKVQLSPDGIALRPNDLLPLADGSVLVAGEETAGVAPRAVVFHLLADGSLDRAFAGRGAWRREGADDASTATSLAANPAGEVVAAVAVRGAHPGAELWALDGGPPHVAMRKPLDDISDGEDLRTAWSSGQWTLDTGGGPTGVVPAASLARRAADPVAASGAASEPGGGGLNPFADAGASAPAAAAVEDGLPWPGIAAGGLLAVAAGGWWFSRRRAGAAPAGAKR